MKKTNASAVTRLLNMNGFVDGHAANSGEVVVVKFEGPPRRVDRAAEVLRDAGYSVDRYDTDALKVLGKPEPARRLCVRGTYSVMIDANAWTLKYGIENIDTIREDVRASHPSVHRRRAGSTAGDAGAGSRAKPRGRQPAEFPAPRSLPSVIGTARSTRTG